MTQMAKLNSTYHAIYTLTHIVGSSLGERIKAQCRFSKVQGKYQKKYLFFQQFWLPNQNSLTFMAGCIKHLKKKSGLLSSKIDFDMASCKNEKLHMTVQLDCKNGTSNIDHCPILLWLLPDHKVIIIMNVLPYYLVFYRINLSFLC